MTYNPNLPATGQSLGFTRDPIRTNFQLIQTTIANVLQPNHNGIGTTGAGKHIFVQMPVQTPSGANLPAANEGGLITETVSGSSELFYVRDAIATYTQLTRGNPQSAAKGSSYLPGGLLINWQSKAAVAGVATFSFKTPFTNPPFVILVSSEANSAGNNDVVVSKGSATNTGFDALTETSTLQVHYIAIGV